MTKLDKILEAIFPKELIFDNKPISHWMWYENGGHLFNVNFGDTERYILLDEKSNFKIEQLHNSILLTEVVAEKQSPEEYGTYKGVTNFIDEADWLGKLIFITFNDFDNLEMRQLIVKNYDKLIFIYNKVFFDVLNFDFRIGSNYENDKWAFYWVRHDSPFYMFEHGLFPRRNTFTDHAGVIWFESVEEAERVYSAISEIDFKLELFQSKKYPTKDSFLKDALLLIKKLAKGLITLEDVISWEASSLE